MAKRVLRYLPPFYEGIIDFVQLDATETVELDQLHRSVQQLFDDQFVTTSSLQAIKRRELMLGIQANPTTESLSFRRRRILNRYQTKPPFTIRYLQQQLDRLVGPGLTLVSVDPQAFVLTVTANIETAVVFREVSYTVEKIKPANLIYQQHTSLLNELQIEERISTQKMNWNYKLDGSWRLGGKPFVSYGTEVVVK